jgi:hypothetical protein
VLVSLVIGDCPGCEAVDTFGNVWVRADHVLRGCRKCPYSQRIPLPFLRKKILYLDQCFLSHAFRAKDQRFVEAAERIRQLSTHQLIAVPFSSVHEDETNQWQGHEQELMKFIKETSFGHEFEPEYRIEETQLDRAFKAFISGGSFKFHFQEDDSVSEDIHAWDDYLSIDIGGYTGDVARIRDAKNDSVIRLIDAFERWRTSTHTFDQQVGMEMEEAARQYLRAYVEYATRLGIGDYQATFDSPLITQYVESLLNFLPKQPIEDKLRTIGNFFRSQYYQEVPYLWLMARIYAVVKGRVQAGAYTNREKAIETFRGFYQDIKHVATYAPYCDAFFMEKTMASIVTDPRIDLGNRYGVRLFTVDTLDELHKWADELEAGMSQEHREALAIAYPTSKNPNGQQSTMPAKG